MISPFDSLEEVNTQLTACKTAIKDVMSGKRVRFIERDWNAEDLDKLQNHLNWLSKERAKFLGKGQSVTVIGRPAR